MKLNIVTPGEFLGDVISDLGSKRGHINSIETQGEMLAISSLAPLAEIFGYATTLRSLTQGRATHSMEFYRYQELPAELTDQIKTRG